MQRTKYAVEFKVNLPLFDVPLSQRIMRLS